MVLEVKVHEGQVTSGQVRIISEVLGEVKVVCIKVVSCVYMYNIHVVSGVSRG